MLTGICFISLMPILLNQLLKLSLIIYTPELGGLLSTIISILLQCNIAIMQFVEEFCLILFCQDFRKLIRKQFRFLFGFSEFTSNSNVNVTRAGIIMVV